MDLKIINKCLHYLEWLGVIEKKKDFRFRKILFFYKMKMSVDKKRRIIYYSLIAVSLPILIFLSYYILSVIVVGSSQYGLNLWLWSILFIPSLFCFVFGIYKSIRERRTKES